MSDLQHVELRAARSRQRNWLSGRMGRAGYWTLVALGFGLGLALSYVPGLHTSNVGVTLMLMVLQIRRLHDFGRTGWWVLAALAGPLAVMGLALLAMSTDLAVLVAFIVELAGIIWIGSVKGDPGDNRFGPPSHSWRADVLGR